MADFFTIESLANLGVLIFLQAVLGFDNLLYISIESARAPLDQQRAVRRWGVVLAVLLRIVMLFALVHLIETLTAPWITLGWTGVIEGTFTFGALVHLLGGAFLIYTAVKEIGHMLSVDHLEDAPDAEKTRTTAGAVIAVVLGMNIIFSFDSTLAAVAITDQMSVLVVSILIAGALMLAVVDRAAEFLRKTRKLEVLGFYMLLIVGVSLLGDGGAVSGLTLFGYGVEALPQTTFFLALAVLAIADFAQSGYAKRLDAERAREQSRDR